MNRRLVFAILAVTLVAVGVAGVIASGAFLNPGPADELAEDSGVFLQPADTPSGERYAEIVDDELVVSIDSPPSATGTIDDVFLIGFEGVENRTDPAEVFIDYDSDVITLRRMDTGEQLDGDGDLVELDPEQRVQVGFTVESGVDTEITELITYTANVPTEEPDGPFFDVTIDDVTTPVTAGDDVTVDATIENTGDETDTQPIDLLAFDDEPVDGVDELTLAPGESTSFSFTWSTDETDVGTGDVTVTSDDDQDTAAVVIEEPDDPAPPPEPEPFFEVTIESATSPVAPGETVTVETLVENVGDATDTQPIDLLAFDDERVDGVDELTLEPGETAQFSFTWVPTNDDIGTGTVTATSLDDLDTATVTVEAPAPPPPPEPEPFFEVTIEDATSPVAPGETVTVETLVENIGNATGTQPVDLLAFDDERVDGVDELTLAPGESERFTFTWVPGGDDIGTGTVTATSLDDLDTATVTVEEPPEPSQFLVNITGTNTPVDAGDTLVVDATVENIGGTADTQLVELFNFDNVSVDSLQVTLEPGESTAVQFRWDVDEDDIGIGNIRVSSEDDAGVAGGTDSSEAEVRDRQPEPEPSVLGLGTFLVPGWAWLLFAVTLTVLTDYLVQTRLRGVLPLLRTARETRRARLRYALARLGLLWLVVLVLAFAAMWLLFAAGVSAWMVFLVILGASILLGAVLGYHHLPDIVGEYVDTNDGPPGGDEVTDGPSEK